MVTEAKQAYGECNGYISESQNPSALRAQDVFDNALHLARTTGKRVIVSKVDDGDNYSYEFAKGKPAGITELNTPVILTDGKFSPIPAFATKEVCPPQPKAFTSERQKLSPNAKTQTGHKGPGRYRTRG